MGSTIYLISRKAKNRIKEAFHRPTELILIIVFAALIVFTIFTGNQADISGGVYRPKEELYAIIFALYALIFFMTAKSGFVNGASMFSMADVNLIFTSPKKQTRVLTYGLLSQLGRSLLLGFFILYQYSWAHDSYGIGYATLLVVLLGYAVTVFLSQMLAMLIYSLTSGDDKKNKALKTVFYVLCGAFLAYVVYAAYSNPNGFLAGAIEAANSSVMKFFPVSGFVYMAVVGIIEKNLTLIIAGLCCVVAFCVLYFVLVNLINPDYYEDVLKATEVSFSAITARKEGKAVETAPRNVKVGKTGIGNGSGASAIFYKHLKENRRSKFMLIDVTSLIIAAVTVAVGYFSKSATIAVAANAYSMIFTVGTGRWAKELGLPYVYLIPEKPFKKLLFMLLEQLPTVLCESVLAFVPLGILLSLSAFEIAALVLVRFSFSFLFIGINLMMERVFGSADNKALVITVYVVFAFLFSVPGIAAFSALSVFSASVALAFSAMALANVLIALILIYACRNILECAQFNNK